MTEDKTELKLQETSEGQGSLACCSPWCHEESDTTAAEQQQQGGSSLQPRLECIQVLLGCVLPRMGMCPYLLAQCLVHGTTQ